jgi:prophage maintenance system killer protein
MAENKNQIVVYQAPNGAVEVKLDKIRETILLTQQQVGQLFNVQKAAVSKHVNNIFATGELDKKSTVSILETVQIEGQRRIKRKIEYYNLDLVLSIGYRVNSTNATKFRQWATKTLRSYIVDGFAINKKLLAKNYQTFLRAVEEAKKLLPPNERMGSKDALELVKMFASTWLSLDAYDRSKLPKAGTTKKQVKITITELTAALTGLKKELIRKEEASELFGQEKTSGALAGIVANIFQAFGGHDLYPTVEEKAANLLYFIAKGHIFTDGNKRSGAFVFVWFLRQAKILNIAKLSPEALTALTLLVAESQPKDKEKVIGLILLLLKK